MIRMTTFFAFAIGWLYLSVSNAPAQAPAFPAPTFYIAASAEFSGTDRIYVRGASNLPKDSYLIVNVYDFVGQGSSVLNQDTRIRLAKDGFFETTISPKPGVKLRSNLVCEVLFMPTFPTQEPTVLRIVGRDGENLNSYGKNPQAKTASGGHYLSDLIHVE